MFMQLTCNWFSVKVVAGRDKFVVILCGKVCEKVVRHRVLVFEMVKFGVLVLVIWCNLIAAVEFGW